MGRVKAVQKSHGVADQVFDQLRTAIVNGELQAGELYSAAALGEQLGVSRTPIREASLELARLGMVRIERNRGIRVVATTVETLLQGFEVRLMLEVPLARRAAKRAAIDPTLLASLTEVYEQFARVAAAGDAGGTLRADRDFHTALLLAAGNERAVHTLREQRNMVLESGVGTVPETRSTVECFEDHRDVYEAFITGDADGTAQAMNRHIRNTATLLIRQEARRREDFAAIDVEARLGELFD